MTEKIHPDTTEKLMTIMLNYKSNNMDFIAILHILGHIKGLFCAVNIDQLPSPDLYFE